LLHQARRAGGEAMPQLARQYAGKLGITEARCLKYLGRSIRYDAGSKEMEAIELFRKLASNATTQNPGDVSA